MTPNTASAIRAAPAAPPCAETAGRVAAGAIARKIVPGLVVRGALVQMGTKKIDRSRWDWDETARNPFFCPDAEAAGEFESYIEDVRKKGSSVGAIIEIVAESVAAGRRAPPSHQL